MAKQRWDGTDFWVHINGAWAKLKTFLGGLEDLYDLTPTDGEFIVGDGTNWIAEDASTARTSLGLGTAATEDTGTSGANVPLLDGANTWDDVQTFLGLEPVVIRRDIDGNTGPTLVFYHNSASPAAGDKSTLDFRFNNDSGGETSVATIRMDLDDATSGSESGSLNLRLRRAGSVSSYLSVANGVWLRSTGGTDPGTGCMAAVKYFVADSVQAINALGAPILPSYTATQIADAAHAVNTDDKLAGVAIRDETNNRIMVASGPDATDPWYVADGSASVTPS